MREPAKTFEDLVVWQKAHQFVLAVHRVSRAFPRSETYGLSSHTGRGQQVAGGVLARHSEF
jgi:hypothetical protein